MTLLTFYIAAGVLALGVLLWLLKTKR